MKQIIILAFFVCGWVTGYLAGKPSDLEVANYNTLPYKIEVIKAYHNHTRNCEALIDSIIDPDTEGGDNYANYLATKDSLDILLNVEE